MKFTPFSLLLLGASSALADNCSPEPLQYHPSIGMRVDKIGSVPTEIDEPFAYNMMAQGSINGKLYFLEQQFGKIYTYDESTGKTRKSFDMGTDDIPSGLTLDWQGNGAGFTNKVHSVSAGDKDDELYVVFVSTTLPTGWSKPDATLPAPGAFPDYVCDDGTFVRDMYRMGTPGGTCYAEDLTTFTAYEVFYKFNLLNNGKLMKNPEPFFVLENQVLPGHNGGAMATVNSNTILWGTGDCLTYGTQGLYAPQLDSEQCGKILSIDPNQKGSYKVVAKGVRNPQQMKLVEKFSGCGGKDAVVFMDIGGVTAEEVNGVCLQDLLGGGITNFGWGINLDDGFAREGTFYIGPGKAGILGGEPPCEGDSPVPESGYVQPWIQFGRTAVDEYYAISGFVAESSSFDDLKLIWSEFNTGMILGTDEDFPGTNAGPVTGYKLRIYDGETGDEKTSMNDFVQAELGEVFFYRGDPRMFYFSDGSAGVFLERTGTFYKLTEVVNQCADTAERFDVAEAPFPVGKTKSCDWVARKLTDIRCSFEGVEELCPFTCGAC